MSVTSNCQAKIRPFRPVNEVELQCEKGAGLHMHEAVLRNYAYQGSETRMSWSENDRRCFEGDFRACGSLPGNDGTCILPVAHHGNHAT